MLLDFVSLCSTKSSVPRLLFLQPSMFWLSGPNFARKKRGVHRHTRVVTRYRDQQTLSNVRHNLARLAWPVTTPASFCVRNVCGLVAWCRAIQIILIPFSIRRLQHRWYPTISACCRPAPIPSPNSIAIPTDTREAWNRKRLATWTRSLSRVQAIFGLWMLSASKALRSPFFPYHFMFPQHDRLGGFAWLAALISILVARSAIMRFDDRIAVPDQFAAFIDKC